MTELAIPGAADIEGMSYTELLQNAQGMFYVPGGTLIEKEHLLGVPHIITKVTFQTPSKRKGTDRDFVSVEATVADEETLARAIKRGRVPNTTGLADCAVEPNERIVYNDGSTGIRRQIVMMLNGGQLINAHDGITKLPEDITNAFDLPWPMWDDMGEPEMLHYGEGTENEREVPCYHVMIHARQGLYASEYTNEYAPDGAVTFYLR